MKKKEKKKEKRSEEQIAAGKRAKEVKAEIAKEAAMKPKTAPKMKPEKLPPAPKKIRMLMSVANDKGAFTVGHSYETGKDISPEAARSYVKTGAAEEDRSAPGPSETK